MKFFKLALVFLIGNFLLGCSHLPCPLKDGAALERTDTAVVGLYLDEKGYAHPTVDQVTIKPGQRIIFVGPAKFDIFFKDGSPIDARNISSENGLVIIEIPKDIFERSARGAANKDAIKELFFRYGIRVNGLVTDPTIRVIPS